MKYAPHPRQIISRPDEDQQLAHHPDQRLCGRHTAARLGQQGLGGSARGAPCVLAEGHTQQWASDPGADVCGYRRCGRAARVPIAVAGSVGRACSAERPGDACFQRSGVALQRCHCPVSSQPAGLGVRIQGRPQAVERLPGPR